jgi:hypothetical protein
MNNTNNIKSCYDCLHSFTDLSEKRICRKFSQRENREITAFCAREKPELCNGGEGFTPKQTAGLFETDART